MRVHPIDLCHEGQRLYNQWIDYQNEVTTYRKDDPGRKFCEIRAANARLEFGVHKANCEACREKQKTWF